MSLPQNHRFSGETTKKQAEQRKTPGKKTDGPRHQIMAMEPAWNTEFGIRKRESKGWFPGRN